jgi:sugar phosphate isomerase/epimerase
MITRREFGKLAASALPLAAAAQVPMVNSRVHGVEIGAQSYSFRDRPLDQAIEGYKEVGLGLCELYQGHVEPSTNGPGARETLRKWRMEVSLDDFKRARRKFDDAGVLLYAYNVSFNDSFTDDEIERGFLMAKALGVDYITASSTLTAAKRVAPFAEKHRITVAMHGHSNLKDPNQFAKPASFAAALAMSKRFAINLDIGHFWAAGFDPVAYINEHHDRIVTLHIKDRKRPDNGPNMPFGQGETPIKAVLKLLKQKKWRIPANIEYEYQGGDTIVEMKRCYEYMKDALA